MYIERAPPHHHHHHQAFRQVMNPGRLRKAVTVASPHQKPPPPLVRRVMNPGRLQKQFATSPHHFDSTIIFMTEDASMKVGDWFFSLIVYL